MYHQLETLFFMGDLIWLSQTRERWTENYYTMRDHALSAIPYPIRVLVGLLIYRSTAQTLHGQGTGRYTDDEIQNFRVEVWEAVNDLLAASKTKAHDEGLFWILGGDEPTEADAALFGFVVSGLISTAYVLDFLLLCIVTVIQEIANNGS